MPSPPTFNMAYLKEIIPDASLHEVMVISATTNEEKVLYSTFEYTKVLVLITKRLIELSRTNSLY